MSTASDKRKAALRKAVQSRTGPNAAPIGETAVRSKPVRITVDLSPQAYKRLTQWANETAVELEAPKVPQAQVIRAFIALLDDPTIAERVRDQLRDMQ